MRPALLLVGLALPLLEIALLIKAGAIVGIWGVLLIIIGTAILGFSVIKNQGRAFAARLSQVLEGGELPTGAALQTSLAVMAGGLLIAPGLLTDFAGLVLLAPPVRKALVAWLDGRAMRDGRGPVRRTDDGATIIEGEFERIEERRTNTREPRSPES